MAFRKLAGKLSVPRDGALDDLGKEGNKKAIL